VQGAAACVTVYVCPAIVSVPVRCEPLGFAPMLKFVEPLPLPVAPLVTVIHAALLVADHVQPVGVVTAEEPVVAPAPAD
jgi:hypothetical protein